MAGIGIRLRFIRVICVHVIKIIIMLSYTLINILEAAVSSKYIFNVRISQSCTSTEGEK